MNQPLLPITGPVPGAVAALLADCQAAGLTDGPAYLWCVENRVFTTIILEDGFVKHWQCEPAADRAAADALQKRYAKAGRALAEAKLEHVAETFPEEFRALLDRAVQTVLGRRANH